MLMGRYASTNTNLEVKEEDLVHGLKSEGKSREVAFAKLVDLYQERMYWHIRRMVHYHDDADDVLQNTFIKIYRNIDRFQGDSKLFTWMYRIATNESITYLQKRNRSVSEDLESCNPIAITADSYFDGDEAQLLLKEAVANLPDRQKAVFNLKYYEDLSYDEIAGILEVTAGALKASYHHAVKKIEQYVKSKSHT